MSIFLNTYIPTKNKPSKIFWVFLIGIVLVIISWFYVERQVKFYVEDKLKKYDKGEIFIESLSISMFQNFPNVAINLEGFSLKEKKSQIRLETLTLVLDSKSLFGSKAIIKKIYAKNGFLHIFNEKPRNIAELLRNSLDKFPELKGIFLDNVILKFQNPHKKQLWDIDFKKLYLFITKQNEDRSLQIKSEAKVQELRFERFKEGNVFLENCELTLNLKGSFQKKEGKLILFSENSILDATDIFFKININPKNLALRIQTDKAVFERTMLWIPPRFHQYAKGHISKGFFHVDFDLLAKWQSDEQPKIRVDFKAKNVSIYHIESQDFIPEITVKGYYHNGSPANRNNSIIHIEKLDFRKGKYQGEGQIHIEDFDLYKVKIELSGLLNLQHFHSLYPLAAVEYLKGNAFLDIKAEGQFVVKDQEQAIFKSTGKVQLNDVGFKLKSINIPIDKTSGVVSIHDRNILIDSLILFTPKSDLMLSGEMIEGVPFLMYNQGKLQLKAEVNSKHIDLDELLLLNNSTANTNQKKEITDYRLSITPLLDIDFIGKVQSLNFEKLQAKDLDFEMLVKDEQLFLKYLKMKTLEGDISLNATVDTRPEELLKVQFDVDLNNINIHSFFDVFYNFGQDLLEAKHLSGRLSTQFDFSGYFDKSLEITTKNLNARIQVDLQEGVLKDFEPLISLTKTFLKFKDFSQIEFAPIQNTFYIKENNFIISPMRVVSEEFAFEVEGNYKVNKSLDVRLTIPKSNFRKSAENISFDKNDLLKLQIKGSLDDLKFYNLNTIQKKKEKEEQKKERILQSRKQEAIEEERQHFQEKREYLKQKRDSLNSLED